MKKEHDLCSFFICFIDNEKISLTVYVVCYKMVLFFFSK